MPAVLERELEAFNRALPDLIKREEGKFVLIIGDEIADIYESRNDALFSGYQRAHFGPFLVKKIAKTEPILRFSRDPRSEWHTSSPASAKADQP